MRTNHIPPLLCISILFGGCSASPSVEANYQITRDIYAVTHESRYSLEWNYSDFKLDDCGRIIEEKQGIHNISFEYDSQGRLSKSIDDGKTYGKTTKTYTYNDDGTIKEISFSTTDSNYKKGSFTITYSYDNSLLKSVDGISKSGEKAHDEYTYDDYGRVTVAEHYIGSSYDFVDKFYYDDNSVNPITYSEQTKHHAYVFENTYDDRGNLWKEDVLDESNERSQNIYDREIIGSVTESPSTNPDLIEGNKWQYFKNQKDLPIPSSCFNSVTDGVEELTYVLPTSQGIVYPALGDITNIHYGFLNSEKAFVIFDEYYAILTQVCGFDVEKSGDSMVIYKEGKAIANLSVTQRVGIGYIMQIHF